MNIEKLTKEELAVLKFVFFTFKGDLEETEEEFIDRNKAHAFFLDMINVVKSHYDPNLEIGGKEVKPPPVVQVQITGPPDENDQTQNAVFRYDPEQEPEADSESNFTQIYSEFSQFKRIFEGLQSKLSKYTDLISDEEMKEICNAENF